MIVRLAAVALLLTCATAGARELSAPEKALLAQGFSRGLKDPQSAQFRWLPWNHDGKSATVYCGMVNGKNSYGGYTGFVPYQGMILTKQGKITGGMILASGSPATTDGQVALKACHDAGLEPQAAR